jgi:hypothetical protein
MKTKTIWIADDMYQKIRAFRFKAEIPSEMEAMRVIIRAGLAYLNGEEASYGDVPGAAKFRPSGQTIPALGQESRAAAGESAAASSADVSTADAENGTHI